MTVEIDQSGKIEDTSHETFLALANGKQRVIKIPAKTKRQLQEIFRRRGLPRLFIYRTFAAGLALLLSPEIDNLHWVFIDREYPGHEDQIKDMLVQYLRKLGVKSFPEIDTREVGKKSPAHDVALKTAHKKRKPDQVVRLDKLVGVIFQ